MSNPLDNKEFKHYLNFVDSFGKKEISEVVGFDASEFNIEQDGYARDITFMNEEIDLEFYKGEYEASETPQILPNGVIRNYLSHAFEWLMEERKVKGFEADIEYILERNGVEFILGNLNFEGSTSDGLTYLKCKVVQNTNRAKIKRRESTKIDVLSTENIDGDTITAIETQNILLKAKPVVQISEWISPSLIHAQVFSQGNQNRSFNGLLQVVKYGIDDTLSWIFDLYEDGKNMALLRATTDLTNVNIVAENISFALSGSLGDVSLYYRIGEDYDNSVITLVENFGEGQTISQYERLYEDISYSLNIEIPVGNMLWMYFRTSNVIEAVGCDFLSGTQTITATSTAIDSVITGVRYIDLFKQSVKSINGMTVNAPKYDVGGEFYDQFAFSGNLLRQITDSPFYVTYKDRRENLMELNADAQVNDDGVFIGQFNDFYANVDNGGFLTVPSSKFLDGYNEKFAINEIEYGYKNYEKDKDEENTIDAVHTETQWSVPNDQVQNTKSISISDIRDPFMIETQRRSALKETTALDSDNKIFVLDVVPLSPSARGGFSATLTHYVNSDGELQLLNDGTFNWGLLGFNEGDDIIVETTSNADTYTVGEITSNIITLIPLAITPTTINEELTQVSYPFTDVAYTNRTDEGFDSIENVASGDKFSNLRYTIRRNMKHWESYFNTACQYTSGYIRNTEFINNADLTTQYDGVETIREGDNIAIDDLEDKILSPKTYEIEVVAEYDEVLALVKKYQEESTIGGFVRCQNNLGAIIKVYPQKLSYVWATKVLSISPGEERFESDFVEITSSGDNIIINEVGYDLDILPEVFYQITGDFIVLYDSNDINLINLTKFDKVKVNGVSFANTEDLAQAIIDLNG